MAYNFQNCSLHLMFYHKELVAKSTPLIPFFFSFQICCCIFSLSMLTGSYWFLTGNYCVFFNLLEGKYQNACVLRIRGKNLFYKIENWLLQWTVRLVPSMGQFCTVRYNHCYMTVEWHLSVSDQWCNRTTVWKKQGNLELDYTLKGHY